MSALHEQDYIPSWFDLYPMVMVTEYKNWKEVNDWALMLFPFDGKLSTGLQNKIEEIQKPILLPTTNTGCPPFCAG